MQRDADAPARPPSDAPVLTGGEPREDEEPLPEKDEKEHRDELVDEASEESFPASDPPAF